MGEQYNKAAEEVAEEENAEREVVEEVEEKELADRKDRKKGVAPQPPKASSARLAERLLRGECAPEAAYEAEGQTLTNQDIAYMLAQCSHAASQASSRSS